MKKMQQEMADRTDYESESYAQLVEKFTQEHERYMMLGGENYEAEIERTLTVLASCAPISTDLRKSFRVVGACELNWRRFCFAVLMCSCSTSLLIIWISNLYNGSNNSLPKVPKPWYWFPTTGIHQQRNQPHTGNHLRAGGGL